MGCSHRGNLKILLFGGAMGFVGMNPLTAAESREKQLPPLIAELRQATMKVINQRDTKIVSGANPVDDRLADQKASECLEAAIELARKASKVGANRVVVLTFKDSDLNQTMLMKNWLPAREAMSPWLRKTHERLEKMGLKVEIHEHNVLVNNLVVSCYQTVVIWPDA